MIRLWFFCSNSVQMEIRKFSNSEKDDSLVNIGVLGLGKIGFAMASNFLNRKENQKSHLNFDVNTLTVFDKDEQIG